VQVNFCKNVECLAFGVSETLHRVRRPKNTPAQPGDYIQSGEANRVRMKCSVCGSKNPVRSNAAVAEEFARLSAHIFDKPVPSCPHEDCDNYGSPVTEPGLYARNGKTPSGTPRWRCNSCRKTFAGIAAPQARQRKPHKNRDVFALLMNKMPLKRIAEVAGIDPKSVYGKIALIHRQCIAFSGHREQLLVQGMALPKMYVAVDRQTHNVNWSNRKDRRNVALSAIASADLGSGYVFGFHLNFDPALDPVAVEEDAAAIGDLGRDEAFRKHARVWLSSDYDAAIEASKGRRAKAKELKGGAEFEADLELDIDDGYAESAERRDVEVAEQATGDTQLPPQGVQLRDQYTMHGHFHLLAALLQNAEKVRCYMDQDSGMRAAFFGAFADRINQRTADGWWVSIKKDFTVVQKERAVQKAKALLNEAAAAHPLLKQKELELVLMKEAMEHPVAIGSYDDLWVSHPVPNMSEPVKKVCWLTNLQDYDEDQEARLYLRASLHAVDRFFMQARRRLSLVERSIVTASSERRVWHGYSAYRPENLAKVLEIFRVFYNFCKVGDDKQTPAMRLGLAKAPIPLEDVLYFQASP
jgi:transposase-like protein